MAVSTGVAPRSSVVIPDTDWATYERLLEAFAERPGVRLAYDGGRMEIMAPRLDHDEPTDFFGHLVYVLTDELGLPVKRGGSTTLRRQARDKGIEADRCYWIANEPTMRQVTNLDLNIHPPPDLAIEVDVTHSSLDRLGIYAALGVPEVWRFDAPNLTFFVLGGNGQYAPADRSLSFPQVTPADLSRYLALLGQVEENAILRQFRTWVRSWV